MAVTDEEIRFYETSMLDMNKEIFLDQARQHQAYLDGGLAEINRLRDSGAIDPGTAAAWPTSIPVIQAASRKETPPCSTVSKTRSSPMTTTP